MNYSDYEEQFLEEMATRLGLTDKTRFVFVTRFKEQYAELNNQTFAMEWERDLSQGTRNPEETDPATVLRDRLKVICGKLAEAGCEFGDVPRGKWKIGKKWLREVKFPEWLEQSQQTVPKLWQQLWERAVSTEAIAPVVLDQPGVETLNVSWRGEEVAPEAIVPLDSKIRYRVQLPRKRYLLLLERFVSGEVFCLSPSFLTLGYFVAESGTIPEPESRMPYLTVTGNPGVEELIAVASDDCLPLDWLPRSDQEPMELGVTQMLKLMARLEEERDCELLRLRYRIAMPASA
jgi:hypothetical protein